ncbi:neutral/alkaline non-lysosomal ceramidase N-terminal domain-containing protein [Archangium sp.]|uniref:neutral/alkaline non-lysosomal ceramidase N-terminal domain-containing protein n=1 Tax=Archangium sp. TaxID=1872627 RepID=UPI002D53A667|nr:neutral/alkaline non-lysosomal ceramidase N-terminal domain-containing protein [Archangium sp.]HYO57615.1 neutral/alkaline non-lysosomal ceramidase N-terminal domain-containing protein [Archangium sp.]
MSPRWRRFLRTLLPVTLLTVGSAYSLASWNWCGRWDERSPVVLGQARAEGSLRAGAAKVSLAPPYPVVVAGYRPPRPEASQADPVPQARAVVLAVGDVKVGLVSLELLLVPDELVAAVRERAAGLGLQDVVVVATHAHSSFGGYDSRLVSQLAGTGRFRKESLEAAVAGASEALRQSAARLTDVSLEVGEARDSVLVRSRSGGEIPDGTLTRAVLRGAEGPVAELLVFAAHPTVVPRDRALVDPDWPGRLSLLREEKGGVALVLQGAVGNVSVSFGDGEGAQKALSFARAVAGLAERVAPVEAGSPRLAFARVEVALPRPDSSRLVPSFSRAAGDNLLCASSSRTAEVGALALGPLELLLLPGEPTMGAEATLVRRTGATGVLGLADGYVAYVETPEKVEAGEGEARRQYFGPALLERLGVGAEVAARVAGFTP